MKITFQFESDKEATDFFASNAELRDYFLQKHGTQKFDPTTIVVRQVSHSKLPAAIKRFLHASELKTVDQVAEKPEIYFWRSGLFGQRQMNQLREWMGSFGLAFAKGDTDGL